MKKILFLIFFSAAFIAKGQDSTDFFGCTFFDSGVIELIKKVKQDSLFKQKAELYAGLIAYYKCKTEESYFNRIKGIIREDTYRTDLRVELNDLKLWLGTFLGISLDKLDSLTNLMKKRLGLCEDRKIDAMIHLQ